MQSSTSMNAVMRGSPEIMNRYPSPFPVPDDTPAVKAAVKRRRGGALKYASDGLTLDWFDMHDIG
jgi:hypothetical protein